MEAELTTKDCLGSDLKIWQKFNFRGEGTVRIEKPCVCGKLDVQPVTDWKDRWFRCKTCGHESTHANKDRKWCQVAELWPDTIDVGGRRFAKSMNFMAAYAGRVVNPALYARGIITAD